MLIIVEFFGTLFTDLPKASYCLSHKLLIVLQDVYGFDKNTLKLVNSYLSNRGQRAKIHDKYSSWSEILFEFPQGSILGTLLFKVFICDMFYFLTLVLPLMPTTLPHIVSIKMLNLVLIT